MYNNNWPTKRIKRTRKKIVRWNTVFLVAAKSNDSQYVIRVDKCIVRQSTNY